MSGIEEKLNYLEETKSLMKDTINNLGGSITDETHFRDYPTQIQHIIDTTIISQTTLNNLVNAVININGEE